MGHRQSEQSSHASEEPLLPENGLKNGLEAAMSFDADELRYSKNSASRWRSVFWLQSGLNLFLVLLVVYLASRLNSTTSSDGDPSLQLYSPANDAVEYEFKQFNRSRGVDKTPWQGWPSDEIDQMWNDLYMPGIITTVDANEAKLLPEETQRLAWPGREDEYLVTLDIFHQMHCLDVVRMALYRDRYDFHFYTKNGSVDYCKWLHVDHCLDQVRQALMCQADVSVVYFEWSDVVQGMRPRVDNSHTCRNYEKIVDWAKERRVPHEEWHPSHHAVQLPGGKFKIDVGRNHPDEGETSECNAI